MNVSSMAYSDRIIYQTLISLIQERGPGAIISYPMICAASGTSLSTTYRALKRLTLTGQIKREFTSGIGYHYTVSDQPAGN